MKCLEVNISKLFSSCLCECVSVCAHKHVHVRERDGGRENKVIEQVRVGQVNGCVFLIILQYGSCHHSLPSFPLLWETLYYSLHSVYVVEFVSVF